MRKTATAIKAELKELKAKQAILEQELEQIQPCPLMVNDDFTPTNIYFNTAKTLRSLLNPNLRVDNNLFQVRGGGKYQGMGLYISNNEEGDCSWVLVTDDHGIDVLVPERNLID
jgi:hypothetical protein